MLRKNFTIIFFFLLVPCFMMGQVKLAKVAPKKVVDGTDITTSTNYNKTKKMLGTPVGESIGLTTNYDSWTNCIVRDRVIWDGGAKIVNMVRPYPNVTGDAAVRHVIFSQKDSVTGVWSHTDVFGGAAGWPDIDISRTGALKGTIGIVGHSPSRLALWDGTGFSVNQFDANTDPSFQFAGDNIWLGTSGNRTEFQFYNSTDGVNFNNWGSISLYVPPFFWAYNGSIEVGISKSADETKLAYYGFNAGADGNNVWYNAYDGLPLDSCDNFWTLTTSDAGTTWTTKEILIDGVVGAVDGLPNYAPVARYMAQVDAAVTNDGTVHAVAAGFGYNFGPVDTTYMFPIIYYNSATDKWKEISSIAIDTIQDLITYNSGRHVGNSYPSISASEDGKVLYAVWTGPQMTGNKLDTAEDGVANSPYYWRDLYHCWSVDGGKTFKPAVLLSSDKSTSEELAQAPQLLRFDPVQGKYVADIVYMAHLGSGSFIQDATTEYDDPLMYTAFTIPDMPGPDGVNDGKQVVRSFTLGQNYPNPFNPSTKIDYTLAEKSSVTLKVYDMLGREVANLVNASQEAGQHNVNFNASKLASGVYIYTLRANNNVMSKKLMLMK